MVVPSRFFHVYHLKNVMILVDKLLEERRSISNKMLLRLANGHYLLLLGAFIFVGTLYLDGLSGLLNLLDDFYFEGHLTVYIIIQCEEIRSLIYFFLDF